MSQSSLALREEEQRLGFSSLPFGSPINAAHFDFNSQKPLLKQGEEIVMEDPVVPPWTIPAPEQEQRKGMERSVSLEESSFSDEKGRSGNEEKNQPSPTVAFGELFRFADSLDYALMAAGTVGAIVHGCSLPVFLRFFADLVNSFGSNGDNPQVMVHQVIKVATFSRLLLTP